MVESHLLEKLTREPIKREGKCIHGKLKMWKERIKINFHRQDVPHHAHCNVTAMLKIDCAYKQSKTTIPRYMLKNVNTLMQKARNVAC